MKHEINQEQAKALGALIVKAGTGLASALIVSQRQNNRARALSAAVEYNTARKDKMSVETLMMVARQFEDYIANGSGK